LPNILKKIAMDKTSIEEIREGKKKEKNEK
jgi:hypothetical protein